MYAIGKEICLIVVWFCLSLLSNDVQDLFHLLDGHCTFFRENSKSFISILCVALVALLLQLL